MILAPSFSVYAEQGQPSVTECMENPTKCKDTNVPNENGESVKNESTTISSWDFLKMIFAFLFVIALLFVLLKFLNKRTHLLQSNKIVQNLGGANLGSNKSVQVVKVGDQVFVLGVGENVQLLSQLSGDEKETIMQKYEQSQSNQTEIQMALPHMIEKWKRRKQPINDNTNFQQLFKKEMNEMAVARKKALHELERDKQQHE